MKAPCNYGLMNTDKAPLSHSDIVPASSEQPNPFLSYIASLGEGSRRTAIQSLNRVAELLGYPSAAETPWHMLRYTHMELIRNELISTLAPSTANKTMSFIRGVLKMAVRLDLMRAEDRLRAIDTTPIRGEMPPSGRIIRMSEIAALMEVCSMDPRPSGARDAAMIAILAATGMRRSELASLHMEDYQRNEDMILIRKTKSKHPRHVPIVGNVKEAVQDWIAVRGDHDGPLFTRMASNGNLTHFGVSDQAVLYILNERAKVAGVEKFSPHDFRRTFVSEMLKKGVNQADIKHVTGHRSDAVLSRYDMRGHEAARAAVESHVHIPYFGRKRP